MTENSFDPSHSNFVHGGTFEVRALWRFGCCPLNPKPRSRPEAFEVPALCGFGWCPRLPRPCHMPVYTRLGALNP